MPGKLNIIPETDSSLWDSLVASFSACDIYYTRKYVSPYILAGDGIPYLIYFEGENGMRLCYPILESPLSSCGPLGQFPGVEGLADWSTPYGFGGPILEKENKEDLDDFFPQLSTYCRNKGIISQFIRFHPVFQNQVPLQNYLKTACLKQTICMDISPEIDIMAELDSKNRNMVRKARKNGIEIRLEPVADSLPAFLDLYYGTMARNEADGYYYFSQEFFDRFCTEMGADLYIFNAWHQGVIISSSMIMSYGTALHYHLSGADRECLHLSPNNLLLYEVAKWGQSIGALTFHLGGGVEALDSLYHFKRSFNKNGLLNFSIGSNIFCPEVFEELVAFRKSTDPGYNELNSRMIKYRA